MGTKNNPGKFDCYANAEPDEPMFILLGRDPVAALLVSMWWKIRQDLGTVSVEKENEARACSFAMEQWAKNKGKDVESAFRAWEKVCATVSGEKLQQARDRIAELERERDNWREGWSEKVDQWEEMMAKIAQRDARIAEQDAEIARLKEENKK